MMDSVLMHEVDVDVEPNMSFPIEVEDNNMMETIGQCGREESMDAPLLGVVELGEIGVGEVGGVVEVVEEVEGGERGGEMVLMEMDESKMEYSSNPAIGLEFESAEAARSFYSAYADRVGFRVRNSKSFTSRVDETVIMRRFVCSKQGRPTKKDPFDVTKKRRNRVSSREGCKAMFQVNRRENGRWVVSRCIAEHCHPLGVIHNTSPSMLKKLTKKPWELIIGPSASESPKNGLGAGGGVVQSLLEYFKRKQADNPAFFYALQVDKNNCVSNVYWTDARAKMAYSYFGDAVRLDLSCKENKRLVPFAAFTGVNHHGQLCVFGCAFMTNESEASFTWLFQTWITSMSGRCPISLVTVLDDVIEASSEKVLPSVCHRFCKRDIFSKCKVKLADTYASHPCFKVEFKKLVNESESVEQFEVGWNEFLVKYYVENDVWLQHLYSIRQKWIPTFVRYTFFAEIQTPKLETVHKFFQRHSITTTTLRDIVTQFDKAIISQYEIEVLSDSTTICSRPVLQSPSTMEKHASDVYTREIFDVFQAELAGSSGLLVDKIEDELQNRFRVTKVEDSTFSHIVAYNPSEKIIRCTCCKFEFSGVVCRHILRVCLAVGIMTLPENYILRRWTKNAKCSLLLSEHNAPFPPDCLKAFKWRCNDLCRDAIRYAEEGATSTLIYKVAKDALQKAFSDVFASKKYVYSMGPGMLFEPHFSLAL